MLYILLGEDDYSLDQALEKIKGSIGDQTLLATNTDNLDGQQVTLSQLTVACETFPFLAERRLVVIRGLLERFESKKRYGQKKTARLPNQQNQCKLMADHLNQIPDTTIAVLIDARASSHNPLFKALSGKAQVKSFPLLRGARLRQWVQQRVKREGGSISPQAVELLARVVGSNLWVMASEIDKLLLFTSRRQIEAEDIKTLVSYAQQASVFSMVDAILEFKIGLAEGVLQQLLQEGAAPAYLLVMLSRQVRMIVRAKELRRQGKAGMGIQTRLGLTSEFALNKTLEQAGRYTMERLKGVYHRLLEADLAIKTGKYDGELALSILVADLCQQGRHRSDAKLDRISPSC